MKVRGTPDQKDGVGLRSKQSMGQNPSSVRGRSTSVLRGKRLFLDLNSHKGQAALESNLKRLGAIIEKCFSKEVEWLITKQGKADDYKRTRKSEGDPERLDYAPSPFNMGHAGIDSPQAPSPNSSQTTKPITRGRAIAQAANLTKTYGSSNLVDNARRWNIRIVHIDVAQKWVDNEIKRYHDWMKHGAAAEQKSQLPKIKRLKSPFVKFETSNEIYRPVYELLVKQPALHYERGVRGSPFEEPRLKRGRHDTKKDAEEPAEAEERDIYLRDQMPPLLSTESKATDSTPLARNARCEKKKAEAQPELVTAGELRRRSKSQYEKQQTGYCEMCQLRYENIDKHVLLDTHRKFVRNVRNYKALDMAIQENLAMAEVIEELVKNHAITSSLRDVPAKYPVMQEDKQTPSHCASLSLSPAHLRLTRSGKMQKDGMSPIKLKLESTSPRLTPRSRMRHKPGNEPLGDFEKKSNSCSDVANLLSISSAAEQGSCPPTEKKVEETNLVEVTKMPNSKLMSPRTAKRKSARKLSLAKPMDSAQKSETKSPAPQPNTPTTPQSSRSNRRLLSRESTRRSLRGQPMKEPEESNASPHRTKSRLPEVTVGSGIREDPSATSMKVDTEAIENTEQKFSVTTSESITSAPKCPAIKVTTGTPSKCVDSPKQSTPLPGSSKKVHDRKVRKLTLKEPMSLVSDHSMHKLFTEDEDGVFEGFDESDLRPSVKDTLTYENVNEVVADVDTLSDKEWDYDDLEIKEGEQIKQNEKKDQGEDDEILDFGSVIKSIGSIGDQSEGDWDEHLETFICDQLTKKQDCSVTSFDLGATAGKYAKDSPLKLILKSPKKTEFKPENMFVYLSPRKKQSPRKLVLSPVKLCRSPGKLIWNPLERTRKPLREMDNNPSRRTDTLDGQEKSKVEQEGPESLWKEDRQKFLKDYKVPARNRFLSPSSGSLLSPSARSRPPRSFFTSPNEFEDELWSGPATDDRSKFAKEGNYYKPSTPKLSVNLKENKSSTPKSYLRNFRPSLDSEGDQNCFAGQTSTPLRREKRLLSGNMGSPTNSVSVPDTSVYNMTDDTLNEIDVKIDEDISFNFGSPQKLKPSKVQRLNSGSGTPGRRSVGSDRNAFGHASSTMKQKDWLDDLDDPNLGNEKTVKEKSIFKNSPRTKKSYRFNYAAAAESKLPHWRKKYAHMAKAKPVKANSRPSRRKPAKRLRTNEDKVIAKPQLKTVQKTKSATSGVKSIQPKSDTTEPLFLDISNTSLNTSGAPSDAPVSPRTRRNLLALVVGIRQHNKVATKDANTSETGIEADCSATSVKDANCKSLKKDYSKISESNAMPDISKMQMVRVSLKRLPSPELKSRPTRACRRLLNS